MSSKKTTENALVPVQSSAPITVNRQSWNSVSNFGEAMALAQLVAENNALPDVRNPGIAILKILAGQEMGFGPCASLVGVHIIEGKPSVGAHLQASAIRSSGVYDYKVIESTRERCELEFLRRRGDGWESMGKVALTAQEAFDSGLSTTYDKAGKKVLRANWARGTDDMLFARCISKGYKRYCPDLTGGVVVYDPDEMDQVQQSTVPVVATVVTPKKEESSHYVVDPEEYTGNGHSSEVETVGTSPVQPEEEDDPFDPKPQVKLATDDQIFAIKEYFSTLKLTPQAVAAALKKRGVESVEKLTTEQASEVMETLRQKAVALQTGAK